MEGIFLREEKVKMKYLFKTWRQESEGSHCSSLQDCTYDNESLDKHIMFWESKWTLHISFSQPLLKLEPLIHTSCLGFMVHLLLYSGLI